MLSWVEHEKRFITSGPEECKFFPYGENPFSEGDKINFGRVASPFRMWEW